MKGYYHVYANGDDAHNFIICEKDYYAEFNLVGICAYNSGAIVIAFSLEDTHPHFLLYGTEEECRLFKRLFEKSSIQHILSTRKTLDNVVLDCQIDLITDESYLRNAGTYIINQPTKDGKATMPYDYIWGTGSMYFRNSDHIPIWQIGEGGKITVPRKVSELSFREKNSLSCTRMKIPDEWLVCNGFILPDNYVDVKRFENIYRTHNCFRAFLASGKIKDQEILNQMANSRGVRMEDLELRHISEKLCYELYQKKTARWLDTNQRVTLAQKLRIEYSVSFRQLSVVCRLPEDEIRKYVK